MTTLETFWNQTLLKSSSGMTISVGDVLLVVVALFAGYLLSRLVELLLARRLASARIRPDLIHVIKRVSFYIIFLLVGLTILSVLGIPVTVFAFATGAIAIGVGFGAQNIINNFISGWILIAERPIKTGDYIEIDGALGMVEGVRARSTLIARIDGVHLLVPNSKLLENTVTNWTLVDKKIRTSLRVGVAYGTDPDLIIDLLREAVLAQNEVLDDPAPEYIFEDFGDSALIFDVFFWCNVAAEKSLRGVRSEMRLRITRLFKEHGVVIPFPQRDIHLHTTPVDDESQVTSYENNS